VLDRALTLATSRQNTSAFALAYLTQGRALLHLAEGQLDDALTSARKAIEFGVQSRFRLELGAAQRVLGQVLEASPAIARKVLENHKPGRGSLSGAVP